MVTPYTTRTILTHCSYPGCERRLNCFEEWAIGVCTLHADPDNIPCPSADPDWEALLARIDALIDEPATGVIPRPNRLA